MHANEKNTACAKKVEIVGNKKNFPNCHTFKSGLKVPESSYGKPIGRRSLAFVRLDSLV